MREYLTRKIYGGVVFALAIFSTTILAVAISGTIKTWTTGEVLKSADLNTTIASLQTAIQNIPNWTKAANGNDAYYTAGNVGIGTLMPTDTLHVIGNTASATTSGITVRNSTSLGFSGISFENSSGTRVGGLESYNQNNQLYLRNVLNSDIVFSTNNTARAMISSAGNVGIGTTSPESGTPLSVQSAGASVLKLSNTSSGGSSWRFYIGDSGLGLSNKLLVTYVGAAGGGIGGGDAYSVMTFDKSTGAVAIPNALSKGSGTFDIAHPDPSMPKNARLRHSFVESPTAGDNIYRWQIKVTRENGKFFIKLPKYWTHLNTNPMVWVSSADQPAASFGYVDMTQEKVIVQADRVGTYNVLLLGTRKDSLATNNWKELGMEYISKGIGEAEKILSYNAQPEFGEEPQTLSNVKTIHELSQQAANEKKLLALEEDNKRLRDTVETMRATSLQSTITSQRVQQLEDRLRAIENTQMARK